MALSKRDGGILGTAASIAAGLLIIYVLYVVYTDGVQAAFEEPTIYAMCALVAEGVIALAGYWYYADKAAWHMRHLSPVALTLGAAAVAAGYLYGSMVGGGLIIIAYLAELAVGAKLYEDFKSETKAGAVLFLLGVLVFMVFLPFALYWRYAAIISMIGDIVKIIGLTAILVKMAGK